MSKWSLRVGLKASSLNACSPSGTIHIRNVQEIAFATRPRETVARGRSYSIADYDLVTRISIATHTSRSTVATKVISRAVDSLRNPQRTVDLFLFKTVRVRSATFACCSVDRQDESSIGQSLPARWRRVNATAMKLTRVLPMAICVTLCAVYAPVVPRVLYAQRYVQGVADGEPNGPPPDAGDPAGFATPGFVIDLCSDVWANNGFDDDRGPIKRPYPARFADVRRQHLHLFHVNLCTFLMGKNVTRWCSNLCRVGTR